MTEFLICADCATGNHEPRGRWPATPCGCGCHPPSERIAAVQHLHQLIHDGLESVRFHGHLTPIRHGRRTDWVCVTGEQSKTPNRL